ncbi:hypothetical protein [Viridibacterium curvum]|uniref:Uncharacterized protein n=1 Tax=Viridibacterium curvum TaxID=1101404 RepID=A0ABP9R4A6_9RHOO
MTESISVVYEPLGTFFGTEYYHQTIVYVNSQGQTYISSGFPTGTPPANTSNISNVSQASLANAQGGSVYGNLQVIAGPINDPSVYQSLNIGQLLNPSNPVTVVAQGNDLSIQWAQIVATGGAINDANLTYSPLTQNSNSAASTALMEAGITPPADTGFFDSTWSPASGTDLSPLIFSQTPPENFADPSLQITQYQNNGTEFITLRFIGPDEMILGEFGITQTTGLLYTDEIDSFGTILASTNISFNDIGDFESAYSAALSGLQDGFSGNTIEFAQSVLGAAGLADTLGSALNPYSYAADWISLENFFTQDFSNSDTIFGFTYHGEYYDITGDPDWIYQIGLARLADAEAAVGDSTALENYYSSSYSSPIAVDLNGDGLNTLSMSDAFVEFDLLGTGNKVRTGWLNSSDAFLVHDDNGDGKITSVSEMFGSDIRGEGYAQLARYDSNFDGVINANDNQFYELKIWQDKNINGITDTGELRSIAEAGIQSLELNYEIVDILNNGNLIGEASRAFISNESRAMGDIYFRYVDTPSNPISQCSQLDLLVDAMARFSPPPVGESAAIHERQYDPFPLIAQAA